MVVSVAFLGLLLASHLPPSKAACKPICNGRPDGSLVPDPNNCHYYYICLIDETGTTQPTPVSFPCPDGEDFDSHSNSC
ncbi:carbohydrate-binding module family 14 protein, partial [Aphanizomenon sp. 202]|nr:carbohydrate-binding module family 14 protein [Aphanizomenon sp. 202]